MFEAQHSSHVCSPFHAVGILVGLVLVEPILCYLRPFSHTVLLYRTLLLIFPTENISLKTVNLNVCSK